LLRAGQLTAMHQKMLRKVIFLLQRNIYKLQGGIARSNQNLAQQRKEPR
jgi:hypothetical protein